MFPGIRFSSLLPLILFALTISLAAAVNNTTAVNEKARFLCTYEDYVTRIVTIDKNVDSFLGLRTQLSHHFPEKPVNFSIGYELPPDSAAGAFHYFPDADPRYKYIQLTTDDDARNIITEYDAVARVYNSSQALRIRLHLYPKPMPLGWDFFWGFVDWLRTMLLIIGIGFAVIFVVALFTGELKVPTAAQTVSSV